MVHVPVPSNREPRRRPHATASTPRPARRRRPAQVSTAYVVLVAWALFHGATDVLERRNRWSHPFGNMTVTADQQEFSVWLPGAILIARVSATRERWILTERELFIDCMQRELREAEAARELEASQAEEDHG